MKVIWAITGAGHLLKESINVLEKISDEHVLTIILSNAGLEVIEKYGYYNKLKEIEDKNVENKIITEINQQYSYPFSGKITHQKYDLIIVSPTTANTTAKIVHGIADTLVTNIVAQSGKAHIPLIVVPVDQKEGSVETTLPPYIKKELCRKCPDCKAKEACPQNAINPPTLDTVKCVSCMKCENTCIYNALVTNEKIELYIRRIDAENTKKLENIENIKSVFSPEEILKEISFN
ncbi:MAG: hypothetical protein BZ138_03550 [Methanosphaera sp. rholeuAM270]|nr:MAG: hypothetical protein BZ138_03550 [Methanosphaera sp. rholeuAM270]